LGKRGFSQDIGGFVVKSLIRSDDRGVEHIPLKLIVVALILAIIIPSFLIGIMAYSNSQAETDMKGELDRIISTVKQAYSADEGTSFKLSVNFEDGITRKIDYVLIGDRIGEHGGPYQSTVRYKFQGEANKTLIIENPNIMTTSPPNVPLEMGSGKYNLVVEKHEIGPIGFVIVRFEGDEDEFEICEVGLSQIDIEITNNLEHDEIEWTTEDELNPDGLNPGLFTGLVVTAKIHNYGNINTSDSPWPPGTSGRVRVRFYDNIVLKNETRRLGEDVIIENIPAESTKTVNITKPWVFIEPGDDYQDPELLVRDLIVIADFDDEVDELSGENNMARRQRVNKPPIVTRVWADLDDPAPGIGTFVYTVYAENTINANTTDPDAWAQKVMFIHDPKSYPENKFDPNHLDYNGTDPDSLVYNDTFNYTLNMGQFPHTTPIIVKALDNVGCGSAPYYERIYVEIMPEWMGGLKTKANIETGIQDFTFNPLDPLGDVYNMYNLIIDMPGKLLDGFTKRFPKIPFLDGKNNAMINPYDIEIDVPLGTDVDFSNEINFTTEMGGESLNAKDDDQTGGITWDVELYIGTDEGFEIKLDKIFELVANTKKLVYSWEEYKYVLPEIDWDILKNPTDLSVLKTAINDSLDQIEELGEQKYSELKGVINDAYESIEEFEQVYEQIKDIWTSIMNFKDDPASLLKLVKFKATASFNMDWDRSWRLFYARIDIFPPVVVATVTLEAVLELGFGGSAEFSGDLSGLDFGIVELTASVTFTLILTCTFDIGLNIGIGGAGISGSISASPILHLEAGFTYQTMRSPQFEPIFRGYFEVDLTAKIGAYIQFAFWTKTWNWYTGTYTLGKWTFDLVGGTTDEEPGDSSPPEPDPSDPGDIEVQPLSDSVLTPDRIVNTYPTGLTWDGTYFWSCNASGDKIYKHNNDATLSIAGEYNSPSLRPSGLAWDGSNLWSCDDWSDKIYKHNMDSTLSVDNEYDSPGSAPSGLTWDGTNIWSSNSHFMSYEIYKHNMDDELSVETTYSAPINRPSGLAWDGSNIWVSKSTYGYSSKNIFKLNMDSSLSIAAQYGPPGIRPSGLTWDGTNIWSCNSSGGKIYKHEMGITLSKLEEYDSPDGQPSGLTWDGTNIWSCNSSGGKIYKHNVDLSVANEYDSPGDDPSGLTWDGTNIWSCDRTTNKIYKHNMDLSVANEYDSPDENPSGLTWDGTNIWSCDGTTNKIYKHKMDATLSVAKEYASPSYRPSGLTWDGTNIWSSDSYIDKIYEHNMDATLSIANEYDSPGGRPSGLTWDGTNIWSCNRAKNKIYKLHMVDDLIVDKTYGNPPQTWVEIYDYNGTLENPNFGIRYTIDSNATIYGIASTRYPWNNKIEANPQVIYNSTGYAFIVWNQWCENRNMSETNTDVNVFLNHSDIYYAILDGPSVIEGPALIYDKAIFDINDTADIQPRLSVDSNEPDQVTVTWVHDEDEDVLTGHNQKAYSSVWNGSGWSDPEEIPDGGSINYDMKITEVADGRTLSIWTCDVDENFFTTHDQQIKYNILSGGSWSLPEQVTDENSSKEHTSLAGNGEDFILVLLSKKDNIYEIKSKTWDKDTDVWSSTEIVNSTSAFVQSPEVIVTDDGIAIITWKSNYEIVNLANLDEGWIYYSTKDLKDDSDWTEPRKVITAWTDPWDFISSMNIIDSETVSLTYQALTGSVDNPIKIYETTYIRLWPDLNLQDVLAEDNKILMATEGSTIQIEATLTNPGDIDANDVNVSFYDGDPRTDGEFIDSVILTNLPRLGSLQASIDWQVESGLHDIYVVLDPEDDIIEHEEEMNNIGYCTVTCSPDLKIETEDISFSSTNPDEGETIQVSADVHNIGYTSADNVQVDFYDGNPKKGGTLIGSENIVLIGIGQIGTATVNWVAPKGTKRIYVEITHADDLDLTNNLDSSYPISILPDLSVGKTDFTASKTELLEGEDITFSAIIHNIGNAEASYALVKFYTPDEFIGYDTVNVSIDGTATVSSNWVPLVGVHLVYVEVDPGNLISERDEANNIQGITVTVFRTMDLTVDMQLEEKEKGKVTITANIPNNGDHEASNIKVEFYDGEPGLGGVLINSTTIDKIEGHDSTGVTFDWETTSGRKTVYAVVDGMDLVPETDETNNVQSKSVQVGGEKEDGGNPLLLILLIIVIIAVPVVLIIFWWRRRLIQ